MPDSTAEQMRKGLASPGVKEDALALPILDIHTRLLYPFSFSRRSVAATVDKLHTLNFKGRSIWEAFDSGSIRNEFYTTESHNAVLREMFGPPGNSRYLSIKPGTGNSMFSQWLTLVEKDNHLGWKVEFVQPKPGVELFLTEFGVGVLSLTFRLDVQPPSNATIEDALIFNYRLSQLRPWMEPTLQIPHPQSDTKRWAAIPPDQRKNIPAAPDRASGLEERLNAPGGEYTVSELVGFLLSPLCEDHEYHADGGQLAVYTVVRLGPDIDFAEQKERMLLSPSLSGLTQVEEHIHAGSLPGEPGVVNAVLNRNHWAGIGCLGAAHVVSDQPGDIAFNEERLQRSRDRYFQPFLFAYLQRLTIRRAGDIVGTTIEGTPESQLDSSAAPLRGVLTDMIQFNALGYLPEVSRREVINRYYRLAQKGLQVDRAWQLTSAAISNLDAACRTAQREEQLQRTVETLDQQKNVLEESRELHAKVEWVEVFIVAVYFAELIHIVGGALPFQHSFVGWSALICSFGAMTTALIILRPWRSLRLKGLWTLLIVALFTIIAFLTLGYTRYRSIESDQGSSHSQPLQIQQSSDDTQHR
jgi:hypothetical protein